RKGSPDLNASTSKDLTTYHASLPANQFSLWAYVFSEMILHPVMREFYPERDVVMEERRLRYDNSPQGFLLEALVEEAFPEGPYHFSAIGRREDIQNLTEEDAYAFHRTYYLPQNMVGVLVGAVPVEQAKPVLERFFGGQKRGIHLPRPQNKSFAFHGERRKTVLFPAEPILVVAVHKPPAPARDDYLFDMLDNLLCEGRTGRFYRRLVEELKAASEVYCATSFPGSRAENLFLVFAAPSKGVALEGLEEKVWAELERIKKDLQQEELNKVRRAVLYNYFWSMKSNAELAEQLAYGEALMNDWRYIVNYPKVIESVTAGEIQSAAKKYFVPNNRVVLYRLRGEKKQ
ncbi:MAG: insulinase family protein, partial [Deltaproteobacteria bacterium]|nr:insulinase family protein [Deltaproteobacteria bacterium]